MGSWYKIWVMLSTVEVTGISCFGHEKTARDNPRSESAAPSLSLPFDLVFHPIFLKLWKVSLFFFQTTGIPIGSMGLVYLPTWGPKNAFFLVIRLRLFFGVITAMHFVQANVAIYVFFSTFRYAFFSTKC